jgi:hypothetical protein
MPLPLLMERGCYTDFGLSGYGVALTLSRKALMDQETVIGMAEGMMLAIAQKCMELGAKTIGHIKCFIRTDAGSVRADTIGIRHGVYATGRITHAVKVLHIAVNSVVMGIPEGAVKAATMEGIYQVADDCGLAAVKEKEHSYFDEFDSLVVQDEIESHGFEIHGSDENEIRAF